MFVYKIALNNIHVKSFFMVLVPGMTFSKAIYGFINPEILLEDLSIYFGTGSRYLLLDKDPQVLPDEEELLTLRSNKMP